MIKEIPVSERPRERLVRYSPSSLANYELLAILLRTGTKHASAIEVAKEVIYSYKNMDKLNEATIEELTKIKGIGKTKAIELIAAIELGKRINQPTFDNIGLLSPKDSYRYLKDKLQHLNQENLVSLYLNTKSQVIAERVITIGTLNRTIFHPREILKWGLKYSAAGLIIAHNHPSGDPTPSKEDMDVTLELIKAAKLVDMIVVDHIIIGKNKYFSFLENNELE